MNCKSLIKKSVQVMAAVVLTASAFGQNAVPQYPVIKSPASSVKRDLAPNGVVLVRQVLADLLAGDYVDTIEVTAKAVQSNAALQVFVDQEDLTAGSPVQLSASLRTYSFAINRLNGIDYKRISIRSVFGSSQITKIVARVSDPNSDGGDIDLPPPPLPPGFGNPPPPPPPIFNPPVVAPPPFFDSNANCSTQSNGFRFSGLSEGEVVQICQQSKFNTGTNDGECLANSHCKAPRMTCSTSSNGLAITGYDSSSTVRKCKAHPSSSDSECEEYLRCEGGQPGPSPVPTPIPGTWFNPSLPCQTKSRDMVTGELHRFSSMHMETVIQVCQDYPRLDKESCRTTAVCQNSGGGHHNPPPPPPPPFPGHPGFPGHGGGHVGPLPPPFNPNACETSSRGYSFVGSSEDSVITKCKAHPSTNNSECVSNSFCPNLGPWTCKTESRGYTFRGDSEENAASKCRAHPSTNNGECNANTRCGPHHMM